MSHAKETTLTFSVMCLSPLMSEVYHLVNLFLKNPSIMPLGVFLVKTKNCSNDDSIIIWNDRIGKMLHNFCISAVAVSLR